MSLQFVAYINTLKGIKKICCYVHHLFSKRKSYRISAQ
jgi:hypothetical protein